MAYIEREALLDKITEIFEKTDPDGAEQVGVLLCRRALREAPAADVVKVVRCKECREWEEFRFMRQPAGVGECSRYVMSTDAHFYCADGVKRED